jgi:beta-xylosidase
MDHGLHRFWRRLRLHITMPPARLFLAGWMAAAAASGQDSRWGDQGDGTYANPVLPGDFSDLDAIRVGRDYYAISSTFQYSPGVVVLHSKDLVNWSIAGHVVDDLTRIAPELNWDKMNRNGRGIWAGSIRYHAARFWVYFGTPDEGFFMSTAAHAAGPWAPVKALGPSAGWDDPCPFWDDDGSGYLVATHFATEQSNGKNYNIHLFQLSSDGQRILPEPDRIIHQSRGSEANKLYKIDGIYYHYFSEVRPEGRVAMINRARSLNGPWETRQLIHVNRKVDKEPNQGGLIQLPSGPWYFISHQGTGDWEGRAGVLLPVMWIDRWPIIGAVGPDGIGNMVWGGTKPIGGLPSTSLAVSDDFSGRTLKPAWEWRYQPRSDKWSLSAHRGFLRLQAFRPLRAGDFQTVGNVLTQRSLRTKRNEVTVKLDLAGMADGELAGIAHFAKTYCTFGVRQNGNTRTITMNRDGRISSGARISQAALWLRSTWDFDGKTQLSYSLDGVTFADFGEPYQLTWASYRGDRIGIFTFNDLGETGYLDVDDFQYKIQR